MNLAASVLTHYCTHAGQLSPEKRLHLANRIATWNGDARAKQLLTECRPYIVPEPLNNETLAAAFEHANHLAGQMAPHMVGYTFRKPFFDRYPGLIGLEAELFRLRHLHELYGINAMETFLQRHPLPTLHKLERAVRTNDDDMRTLSTWIVNFIYLFHRNVLGEDNGINVQALYELGKGYDTTDHEQLRLLIYLYTHCIIADSNFYARAVPPNALPTYRHMLASIEKLIVDRLRHTSLDTKLEFLVCCRLIGYKTRLRAIIHDECAQSVSPEGTFLIDTHNTFAKNPHKKSFEESEHRNVLFIMSVLPRLNRKTA